jgi:serine/threonine protein kinase
MLAPNTLLQDRYLVLRLLGQGGMGAVYQATDRKFGNAVAVKETFYGDQALLKAFSREARLLNGMRHPALPVVMDYFSASEKQFLVMQYIPGKDLEQLLEERKASDHGAFMPAQVMQWADQLLDALEYLHTMEPPIIHRDIKPQNLKLTPRGEVILLDFGLAKGVLSQAKVGQSLRGYTLHYASLEQIRGAGTDERSDIYSLGATLYHLLTGVMPPDAMTRMAAGMMGECDLLQPAAVLNPAVPRRVSDALAKAMALQPDQRYASAAIMRQALRNASRNLSVTSFHRSPTLTGEWASRFDDPPAAEVINSVIIPLDQCQSQAGWQNVEDSSAPEVTKSKKTSSGKVRPRRMRSVWYAVSALLLMSVTTAMMMYRSEKQKIGLLAGAAEMVTVTRMNTSAPNPEVPMRLEVLRYFLETISTDKVTTRATGMMPLSSGSRFRFHFKPRQSGYLYLIALGKNGRLQTFLTDHPLPASGVTINWSAGGNDFQFPDGGQWFLLPRNAESAPFTIIFSPQPLRTPDFLGWVSGHELNETELQALAALRKQSSSASPNLVALADDNQPAVAVQTLAARDKSEPVVFDIMIKKK